ncbi:MAG: hypothetical protein EPO02_06350 [Nitrospirae bacterium]|nr:MAG: hypothetical protein EPO02_06350 [Nitrospirota bacterium]
MLRFLFVMLIAAPTLWGCVSLDQHAALREAYNKLDAERQPSKQALQAAQTNVAKLSSELKRVQQEVQDLQARLQQTNQQVADLSTQLDAAKKALAAKEEDRAKSAKETKPAKRGKKP